MDIFTEISLIIVLATVISALMRLLKQPLIIGYIITGLIVGPNSLGILDSSETFEVFSKFGIALLLFIVGLHLSPKVIRDVGKGSLIAGSSQVIVTTIIGFIVLFLLGFSYVESLYLGIAFAFSSTIIVLKLLYDKGDLEKLYGKIAIGFLIIQDVVATVLLIFVAAPSLGATVSEIVVQLLLRGSVLAVVLFFGYKFLFPTLTRFFASSQEFLFLFALGWGMGLASLFHILGFSIEIGALVAGVMLSMFPYNHEIGSKMRPLRDFFLILFFILLGAQIKLSDFSDLVLPATVLSFFVIVGNPLIVMVIMGTLGYKKKIGFLAGLTMSQISEFSLILIAAGVTAGYLSERALSVTTLVALLTITVSSYLISYSDDIYSNVSRFLNIFEREKAVKHQQKDENYDVILFGYNRIGYDFLNVFEDLKCKMLVVDFDPSVIADLIKDDIPTRYGDADDGEFLDELKLDKVKMVVSTIPDYETNLFIVEKVRSVNKECIIFVRAHSIDHANKLYNAGADYVVMPHFLGGEYASQLVKKNRYDKKGYYQERKKHIKKLDERMFMGHDYPYIPRT